MDFSLDIVDVGAMDVVVSSPLATEAPACLRTRDTGTEITEEVKSHLFELFFTAKPAGKGTGLGLSRVYGIVSRHNGHIHVDSTLGQGAVFSFYLPLADDVTEDPETAADTTLPEGRGEFVLVVEDQHSLREAISIFLLDLGYDIVAVADGWKALQVAQKVCPDLLLTDLVMPKLGGQELLQRIREYTPHLRAIAITGHSVDNNLALLKEGGFNAILAKPFDLKELSETIRFVLDA